MDEKRDEKGNNRQERTEGRQAKGVEEEAILVTLEGRGNRKHVVGKFEELAGIQQP